MSSADLVYLLPLNTLDGTTAQFEALTDGIRFVITRPQWESLGRPATIRIEVSPHASRL